VNILHLVSDEKFILFFASVFSGLENVNNRYVVRAHPSIPLKHINTLDIWRYTGRWYYFSSAMHEDLKWADCIICHYLISSNLLLFINAPPHVVKVWSGWGGDYYHLFSGGQNALLGDETKKLLSTIRNKTILESISTKINTCKNKLTTYITKKLVYQINLFSAPLASDFNLLKSALGHNFTADYIQLNYGSLEATFMPGYDNSQNQISHDILIGNSATPSNNHIEAFRLIEKHTLKSTRVITPLSYGDPEYRDVILIKGKEILGEKFFPIINFMSISEYNSLISQCAIVIMNHKRQQALGNIGAMLYRGAKVFLDEKNPVYTFFKQKDAYIYSTNLLTKSSSTAFAPLTEPQIQINRAILKELWGHDVVIRNAEAFIKKIEELRK
jgi:dTDP-N-acetylfucosamine:lipid II N-acetylfucosaminyltransferase